MTLILSHHVAGAIMSHQLTLADSEFSSKSRQTRKEIFLSRMEQICAETTGIRLLRDFPLPHGADSAMA